MPPLTEMATFAHVVDSGSFSAAARRLGGRKSSLSAQIQRLESRLGVRLLNRTTRRIALTEAGAVFYEHCARIVSEAEAAADIVDSFHKQPRGRLTVSAPDTFGWMHIAPLLPAFLRRYPDLTIDLLLSDRHVDLLAEHVDMAIRIGKVMGQSLTVRRLTSTRLLLCAAPDYLKERPPLRNVRDIAGHDTLVFTPLGWGDEWRLHQAGREHRIRLQPRLRSTSGDVLRAAAIAGAGIALLPQWMVAADLAAGRLRVALPRFRQPGTDIHAVFPPGRGRAAKVVVFTDYLAQNLDRSMLRTDTAK